MTVRKACGSIETKDVNALRTVHHCDEELWGSYFSVGTIRLVRMVGYRINQSEGTRWGRRGRVWEKKTNEQVRKAYLPSMPLL
jgi:hypothetical protein